MEKSKKHKLVVNKEKYTVLSADTDFYKFVDDSRLYYSFERLICEEDRKKFTDNVAAGFTGWFVVHLEALDGAKIPCYLLMEEIPASDNLELVVLDIAMISDSEWEMSKQCRINDTINSLYADDMFFYYPARNEVEISTGTGANRYVQTMTLEQLQQKLENLAEDKNTVSDFIGGLRSGSRYLFIKLNGSIKTTESEMKHSIIKCSGFYERGVHTMTVGYLHEYMERTYSDTRKIEIDSLTGLIAKGEITNMVIRTIDMEKRQNVSLAIVDIDHFKRVNDEFGHMTGDTVIQQVATIISEEVGNEGLAGRIGGDEFMILFYNAYDLENSRERLRSIKNTVSARYPADVPGQPAITLSIGCAAYPKDASNYEELFALADFALYRAKEKGRNRYIIYNKEKHGTITEIKKTTNTTTRINTRGDMSMGEIMCVIMDRAFSGKVYPVERLLDDYIENFEVPRISVYDRKAGHVLYMAGQQVPSDALIARTEQYILSEYWQKRYANPQTVINDITTVAEEDERVYVQMKAQGVLSCIHIPFQDRNGRDCVLALEAVNKKIAWNMEKVHYFRLMAKILLGYVLV